MPIADLTRQRLARAALEHFTTRGYETTTTAEIAKKAGVSEGAIYRHFTGKQQLLNDLYRASARWATEVLQQAEAGGGAPRERLARVGGGAGAGAGPRPGGGGAVFPPRHGGPPRPGARAPPPPFPLGAVGPLPPGQSAPPA